MLKKSISLINNSTYDFIKKFNIDGVEVIANKNVITSDTCSIQSLYYGCKIGGRIVENKDEYVNFLAPTIYAANKVGANLVFGSPKLRSCNNTELYILEDFFRDVDSLCNNSIFSIEPNAPIYGGNNLFTSNEVAKFIRDLNLNHIKLNYDLGTAFYNKENLDFIENNIDLINHVHISAPNLISIRNIDRNFYVRALSILNYYSYSKFISLESLETNLEDEINYFLNLFNEVN